MWKRWVIRGVCLALVALCLAAWVASASYHAGAEHCPSYCGSRIYLAVSSVWGTLNFHILWGQGFSDEMPYGANGPTDETHFWPAGGYRDVLGFNVYYVSIRPGEGACAVNIPYWAIALSLLGLTSWAWWKTRKRAAGRGFPIEINAAAAATPEPRPEGRGPSRPNI